MYRLYGNFLWECGLTRKQRVVHAPLLRLARQRWTQEVGRLREVRRFAKLQGALSKLFWNSEVVFFPWGASLYLQERSLWQGCRRWVSILRGDVTGHRFRKEWDKMKATTTGWRQEPMFWLSGCIKHVLSSADDLRVCNSHIQFLWHERRPRGV